jgi:hypothetical protein
MKTVSPTLTHPLKGGGDARFYSLPLEGGGRGGGVFRRALSKDA